MPVVYTHSLNLAGVRSKRPCIGTIFMYGDTQGATQCIFTFATATYVVGLFVFGHAYEAGIPLMHSGRAFGRKYYAYQYLLNLSCKLI